MTLEVKNTITAGWVHERNGIGGGDVDIVGEASFFASQLFTKAVTCPVTMKV